jgi:hypothetical protein
MLMHVTVSPNAQGGVALAQGWGRFVIESRLLVQRVSAPDTPGAAVWRIIQTESPAEAGP